MRNPFARQLPGFRIEAGTDSAKNGKIDIACTTDKGQGIIIYENGNCDLKIDAVIENTLNSFEELYNQEKAEYLKKQEMF